MRATTVKVVKRDKGYFIEMVRERPDEGEARVLASWGPWEKRSIAMKERKKMFGV